MCLLTLTNFQYDNQLWNSSTVRHFNWTMNLMGWHFNIFRWLNLFIEHLSPVSIYRIPILVLKRRGLSLQFACAVWKIVEMCDSAISELCLGDFSQYCPFNNQPGLPDDRRPKSTIGKRIALFSSINKADSGNPNSQHHLCSASQPILQQSNVSREDIGDTPKSFGGGREPPRHVDLQG